MSGVTLPKSHGQWVAAALMLIVAILGFTSLWLRATQDSPPAWTVFVPGITFALIGAYTLLNPNRSLRSGIASAASIVLILIGAALALTNLV